MTDGVYEIGTIVEWRLPNGDRALGRVIGNIDSLGSWAGYVWEDLAGSDASVVERLFDPEPGGPEAIHWGDLFEVAS